MCTYPNEILFQIQSQAEHAKCQSCRKDTILRNHVNMIKPVPLRYRCWKPSEPLPKCQYTMLMRLLTQRLRHCTFFLCGAYWFPLRNWLTQAYVTQGFSYASLLWHKIEVLEDAHLHELSIAHPRCLGFLDIRLIQPRECVLHPVLIISLKRRLETPISWQVGPLHELGSTMGQVRKNDSTHCHVEVPTLPKMHRQTCFIHWKTHFALARS